MKFMSRTEGYISLDHRRN